MTPSEELPFIRTILLIMASRAASMKNGKRLGNDESLLGVIAGVAAVDAHICDYFNRHMKGLDYETELAQPLSCHRAKLALAFSFDRNMPMAEIAEHMKTVLSTPASTFGEMSA